MKDAGRTLELGRRRRGRVGASASALLTSVRVTRSPPSPEIANRALVKPKKALTPPISTFTPLILIVRVVLEHRVRLQPRLKWHRRAGLRKGRQGSLAEGGVEEVRVPGIGLCQEDGAGWRVHGRCSLRLVWCRGPRGEAVP